MVQVNRWRFKIRGVCPPVCRNCLSDRVEHLGTDAARANFLNEMRRFLPSATVEETLQKDEYWQWL